MKNFTELDHPILRHKLAKLRDIHTEPIGFRAIMNELGTFLAFEAARTLDTESFELETPLQKTMGTKPKQYPVVVSIMRAGNGMLDGVLHTLPYSPCGHIGIYRDKFINNTVEYYFKLPENHQGRDIFLIDPMVATADTAIASIDRLKNYDVGKITMLCVLISPHGLEKLHNYHPDVDIIAIKKEEGLNDKGYLLPGIGDAGDRLYNTN
jgi:uracil phosphoribosyltransferase